MTEPATDSDVHARPEACENCGSVLQGHYCHVCGQRAHNPLHHFGHAVEEVFESFWHLDGRIFRTLRDLPVPGRIAENYLAGHRVRYIAPLRLFVILTLLAFFVGHFAVRMERPNLTVGADDRAAQFSGVSTVEGVERVRSRQLAALRANRELDAVGPFGEMALDAAEEELNRQADARIRELRGESPSPAVADGPANAAGNAQAAPGRGMNIRIGDEGWDPRRDPVAIPWLPEAANAWLTAKARRGVKNAERVSSDPEAFKDAWMQAVPSMLFVLVPFFALLLKLTHAFTGRGYLEHLVVALYSHAWLMLVLLLLFLTNAASEMAGEGLPGTVAGIFQGLLWLGIPIYLFLMQRRIYRQPWWLTIPKFWLLGMVYSVLLVSVVLASMAVGLVKM
ncbi:MAG: DUF3667 domain-containing protein [Pseudomonadota bacterium]